MRSGFFLGGWIMNKRANSWNIAFAIGAGVVAVGVVETTRTWNHIPSGLAPVATLSGTVPSPVKPAAVNHQVKVAPSYALD